MNFILNILKLLLGLGPPEATKEKPMETTPVSPSQDVFDTTVLPLTLIFEGGFNDDPVDRGGRTNRGIIQTEYDKYRQGKNLPLNDVKNISDDEVNDIYLNGYWLPSKCDQMPDKVATVVFDTSVNSGQGRSIKTLQQAVGAVVDGAIGPETISKLKSFDQLSLANTFLANRVNFYNAIVAKDPTQQKFLGGWLRRVNFTKDFINGVKTLDQIRSSW